MNDLTRLQSLTANYEALQGLKLVPTALPVGYAGVAAFVGDALEGPIGLLGFLATVAVAGALAFAIGRWYARRYGVVRRTREQRRALAIKALAGLAVIIAAAFVDAWLDLPFSLYGLVTAATLGLYWRSVGNFRPVHLAASTAIALVSLLPLAGISAERPWGVLFLTFAVAFLVVGLADHRYLRVALPAAPEQA